MSMVSISTALKERLMGDEELLGLLIAQLPEDADARPEAMSLRFCEQSSPGTTELPCVLWTGDPQEVTPARCGGFGAQRTRYRVEVVATGDDLGALEPIRARIETLLAGWDSGEFATVLDGPWGRKEPGVAGQTARLGNYYVVIE